MKEYQLHKIADVDKSICTCEQMLAYNNAFAYHDLNITGAGLGILILKWNANDKRYNWNAVAHLVSMNLDKYRSEKHHILSSYEEVGKMFPVKFD